MLEFPEVLNARARFDLVKLLSIHYTTRTFFVDTCVAATFGAQKAQRKRVAFCAPSGEDSLTITVEDSSATSPFTTKDVVN